MYPNRRNPSYTLPRNFTFHFHDGNNAPTPQDQPISEQPRQVGPYRLRRRREHRQMPSDHFIQRNPDIPIPTIEVFDSPSATSASKLASLISSRPKQSPPRTPVPQIQPDANDDAMSMDHNDTASQAESISRPSTACSGFSDSSASSSVESFPSLGGSFTSPECDNTDSSLKKTPMVTVDYALADSAAVKQARKMLPTTTTTNTHTTKQPWTEEMDSHLWLTYMKYLQDPRHTPFKMLPGTSPPLGVCSRVAREAKRSWKGQRARTASRAPRLTPHDLGRQADSPDTIKPTRSGSVTPTDGQMSHKQTLWPRSDASTRRRLRELCKSKPTLSAHYNRLLATRSPSPFSTASSSRPFSRTDELMTSDSTLQSGATFATRDMSLSLFSSTSSAVSTMNQFTAESSQPKAITPPPIPNSVARPYSHQKSRSLHSNVFPASSYRHRDGLASPFQPFRRSTTTSRKSVRDTLQTPAAPIPRLASPLQFAAPRQRPRQSVMHCFQEQDDDGTLHRDTRAPFPELDNRFSGIAGRRSRSRAVSMGDVSASSRRLSLLFEPPPSIRIPDLPLATTTIVPAIPAISLSVPQAPPAFASLRRLGSPFTEKPSRPLFNTFPRNFSLHGLEPALESHEERLTSHDFQTDIHGTQHSSKMSQ